MKVLEMPGILKMLQMLELIERKLELRNGRPFST